jgi:hypothetical protein
MEKKTLTFHHQYHQTMVYKIFMASKNRPEPITTYEEALDIIKGMYHITQGMKQIAYLVGWQYEGHDSKYPAWFECNKHLMRSGDIDSREGFRWLVREAKAYNAVVSLHVNMSDAYENSPLWDEYVKNDLIVKNDDGTLKKSTIWDGEQSYWVNKKREWESGFAQKRIDRFLQYLPEIVEAETVHIDAMFFAPDELEIVQQICSYWNSKGIDVTSEFLGSHELVGYIPMVWQLNLDEQSRLRYPPSLLCGGSDQWNQRETTFHNLPPWAGYFCVPEAGTRYEEVWGRSFSCDIIGRRVAAVKGFSAPSVEIMLPYFCERTLPWCFLNRHRALELRQTSESYEVIFSDGVKSHVRVVDRMHRITQNGRLLAEGGDYFIPAAWLKDAIIAWSRNGCRRSWSLPPEWLSKKKVRLSKYDASGKTFVSEKELCDGTLDLEMPPATAWLIEAI